MVGRRRKRCSHSLACNQELGIALERFLSFSIPARITLLSLFPQALRLSLSPLISFPPQLVRLRTLIFSLAQFPIIHVSATSAHKYHTRAHREQRDYRTNSQGIVARKFDTFSSRRKLMISNITEGLYIIINYFKSKEFISKGCKLLSKIIKGITHRYRRGV